MTERPAVSVALCTHNGARYVVEQVRSILAQSEPPAQVVLSDDASTDDTVALVEGLWAGAQSAPELLVLRNPVALGVTANFEQAVLACTGELVALCDQDDVWAPDRLERMVDVFQRSPGLSLLFTDARLVDEAGADLGPSLFEALEVDGNDLRGIRGDGAFAVLLRRNLVTGATVLFRRSLLDSALPFDPDWVHDEWLAIIAAITGRVDFLPLQLIEYRQHGGNQIGARKPTLRDKIGRVTESRTARNARLSARAQALVDRGGYPPEIATLVAQKAAHEQRRQRYPAARLLRLGPVLRTALSGDYGRYGRGRYDVVRDLLQPDA